MGKDDFQNLSCKAECSDFRFQNLLSLQNVEPIWRAYMSPATAGLTLQNLVDKGFVRLVDQVGIVQDGYDHNRSPDEIIFISMHELHRKLGQKRANPSPVDVATLTRVIEDSEPRKLFEKEQEDVAVKFLAYSHEALPQSKSLLDLRRWKDLQVLWEVDMHHSCEIMFPPSLRYVRLQGAAYNKIRHIFGARDVPDFPRLSSLINLKTIHISECSSLTELPESFGELAALAQLEIVHCEQLTGLPQSLGQLQTLLQLLIDDCQLLTELPESLGELSALSHFEIRKCTSLRGLPESLGKLSALRVLRLFECEFSELPESLGQLESLEELYVHLCGLEKLPESFEHLQKLKELAISGCFQFKAMPESVGKNQSLKHLTFVGGEGKVDLTKLCIRFVEYLDIGSFEVPNLGFVDQARALQHLTVRNIGPPELPISVGLRGTGLVQNLTIELCNQRDIEVLPSSLEYLKLQHCYKLRSLPVLIGQLSRLRKIVISVCPTLGDWRPSPAHVGANLQELKLIRDLNFFDLLESDEDLDDEEDLGARLYEEEMEEFDEEGGVCGPGFERSIFLREDLLKLATEGKSLLEGAKDQCHGIS